MIWTDILDKAVATGGPVYSEELDLANYKLPAWQFAVYHIHSGAGSLLHLRNSYSYDKTTWINGAIFLTGQVVGSGIVAVDEATINRLYPMRYFRIGITVTVANASNVHLILGMS